METKQLHIRLTPDENNSLKSIADKCGLNPTALAAVFLRGAIQAVNENRDQFPLPLRFKIVEASQSETKNNPVKK